MKRWFTHAFLHDGLRKRAIQLKHEWVTGLMKDPQVFLSHYKKLVDEDLAFRAQEPRETVREYLGA